MNLFNPPGASRKQAASRSVPGRLIELADFGSNPGNLGAVFHARASAAKSIPLVVVLHGCTQTAQEYDNGSGWSELAEAYGFAVLFPEQRRANNPNLCFNWFDRSDTRRGGGEALSIAQMVAALIEHHAVDAKRVYITGLSAGGAMTSVMLATYPEMFAGGAILAGLPHGAAGSVHEALQQMRRHRPSSRTSGSAIHQASDHQGIWPTVSIWHGTADTVVDQSNADAILQQWLEVHALSASPSESGLVEGHPHRIWRDKSGKLLVEEYRVTGMGHGTPLATVGELGCGEAGAFMLEVGISSTIHSAKSWRLLGKRVGVQKQAPRPPVPVPVSVPASRPGAQSMIGETIEAALRAAGLLR